MPWDRSIPCHEQNSMKWYAGTKCTAIDTANLCRALLSGCAWFELPGVCVFMSLLTASCPGRVTHFKPNAQMIHAQRASSTASVAIPKQKCVSIHVLLPVVARVQNCWRAAQVFVLSASRAGLQGPALDLTWILGVHDRHDWQQQMPAAPVQQ